MQLEKHFDAGQYQFEVCRSTCVSSLCIERQAQIEEVTFSMREYNNFVESVKDEVKAFKARQAEGVALEEARFVLHASYTGKRPAHRGSSERLTSLLLGIANTRRYVQQNLSQS